MRNRMPRWELWLDALVVGFLFAIGLGIGALPVLWMMELV